MLVTRRRPLGSALAAALALTLFAHDAHAQRRVRARFPDELRGSQESVQKMWDFATMHGLAFYQTPRDIDKAVAEGKLVPLDGDASYELTRGVGFSYATREAKQFIVSFAPQYLAACGTPLIVTSAARPTTRQPRNSNPYSVHPTGIAVDVAAQGARRARGTGLHRGDGGAASGAPARRRAHGARQDRRPAARRQRRARGRRTADAAQ
jgi:hypothetical protein